MQPPRGWALHVVVGNGSPYETFRTAQPPSRRFSHLWVSKAGHVEQYAPLSVKSWAQAEGNAGWWSVETEGYPGEQLTGSQLDALAAWHVWSRTADRLAETPSETGIGTHQMGGQAWGGHACPGQVRAPQRAEILRRAQLIRGRGDDMATAADVWDAGMPVTGEHVNAQTVLSRIYMNSAGRGDVVALAQQVARLGAAVDALRAGTPVILQQSQIDAVAAAVAARIPAAAGGGPVDPRQLAAATADELAARLRTPSSAS